MRTDMLNVPSLLLAAALLGAGAPLLAAQSSPREEVAREEKARAAGEIARTRTEEGAEAAAHALMEAEGVSVLTGDHTVAKGEVVEGDMVVVGGDLRVEGEIRGDAVVTGGNLEMREGGTVRGDAVVTGGKLLDLGGRVLGEMRSIAGGPHPPVPPHAPEPPAPPIAAVHGPSSLFVPIGRGIAGIFSTLAFGLVLAGVGAGLIFYGLPYLRTVSDTVRTQTGRSAAVGLAATFLIIPAFILLVVALAVSIIGIPLLLVAVPLYPLAVAAAFGFGLIAVAHVIGERTAEQRGGFDLRHRNAYSYVFFGIALLLAPLAAAHLIGMVGFLDWVGTLLRVMTGMVLWAAATVGMGAVVLTRAGTRPPFIPSSSYDPVLEEDPLFDSEPATREPHV
ncbi:MAG TPA: polymer-forming cytoskeletal protein [Longimicrobiaceae bacterium]|nr:polymer-forming cytoskeletal protein [Longimicrobiaceae bacterium]